jgi:anti-sigma-K factor RskA
MLPSNHVLDLIPGYALDCLGEQEKRQVAEHLKDCASCKIELAAYQHVVSKLHQAAPLAEPPPELKQKILNSVAMHRAPMQTKPARTGWQQLWDRLQGAAPIWAYASFALVILLGVSNLFMLQRINRLGAQTPSEFRMVSLVGTEKAPKASGLLVMSHDGNTGTLVVDSLQLWLIKDGKRTSGGVFSVSPAGYGALAITAEQPLKVFSAFGITIEPAGGSPGPTGDKVLGGSL